MNFLVAVGLPLWRQGLRGLGALLCNLIYWLISCVYQLFITLAKVNFLSTNAVEPIYQRVTMVLTIVMTFYITFEFVKYVITPDNIEDKEKGVGNILQRIVIVIILIAFVPKIFSLAYSLQSKIIENQVISKIILGKTNTNVEQVGGVFSANILGLFYGIDEEACASGSGNCADAAAQVEENLSNLRNNGKINLLEGINETVESSLIRFDGYTPAISFNGFFAIGVGAFILYVLALYSVDVGIRYAQLLFLQVMAPIAIMGYILPKKDGIFQKWTKQCLTTYVDLFIRIAIIYFILLLIEIIGTAYDSGTLFEGLQISKTLETFAYIILIMGLLTFASRAPKLLGELFPSSGAAGIGFGFKAGERVGALTARTLGAALGATKLGTNMARRIVSNVNRNRANGQKSILTKEGQEQWRQRRENRRKARNLQDLSNRTDDLNRAEDDLRLANRRLNDAKRRNAPQSEIDNLTRARDEALSRYQKQRGGLNDLVDIDRRLHDARQRGDQAEVERLTKERNAIKEKINTSGLGANEIYQADFTRFQNAGRNLAAANRDLDEKKASGDPTAIAEATKRQAEAQIEFDKETANMQKYGSSDANSRKSNKEEAKVVEANRQAAETARQNLESAIASGDQARITAAQENYTAAQTQYETARANYLNEENVKAENKRNQLIKDLEPQIQQANEQVAEDSNKQYKSIAGAAIGGIGATVKTIVAGAGATKLEDITKKVDDAVKKDVKQVVELNKYYDAGGAGGIQGVIDRTAAQIEKKTGIETQYQRTVLHNKALEPQIKKLEAQSSLTKDVKSTADSAEDRLKEKINELTQVVSPTAKIKTGLTNADGSTQYADIGANETIGDLHRKYVGRAERAKAEAEAAAKRVDDFEGTNTILTKDRDSLSDADKATYDTAKAQADALRANAQTKAKEAADADYAVTQVQKNAARYQYSSILKDMAAGESIDHIKSKKYDKVAVEKVQDALESLKVLRQNPEAVEKMREKLKDKPTILSAFLSGKIEDFETLDEIKTAAINSGNEYERILKQLKEEKRYSETSNATAAQKAANDFNGGNS